MTELDLGVCDVCAAEPAVGVAAAPGIPMSLAYGQDCLSRGLSYPRWLLVANTAMIGGLDDAASWWLEEVERHLAHFGWDPAEFEEDVATEIAVLGLQEQERGL